VFKIFSFLSFKAFFFICFFSFSFIDVIKSLGLILPLLISIAFFTVFERKVLGSMQRRRGPNILGLFGSLQSIADALKLLSKETIIPGSANFSMFVGAPIVTLVLSLVSWSVIPFFSFVCFLDTSISLLLIFAFSSLSAYSIIIAG
jgi:NADH:ubiquinone oxidoreductase subunit H